MRLRGPWPFALLGLSACARSELPIDVGEPPRECLGAGSVAASSSAATGAGAGAGGAMSSGSTSGPVTVGAGGSIPTTGPRLRAYFRITDEGTQLDMPGMWFDSLRHEDCRWRKASDGVERCLPDATTLLPIFGDAACKQPVVVALQLPTCPAQKPDYVTPWIDPGNTCVKRGHVFEVGASAEPAAMYRLADGEGGACLPYQREEGSLVFDLGPEVPPASFVGSEIWHH